MFVIIDNTNQNVRGYWLTFNHAVLWASRHLKGINWSVVPFIVEQSQ